MLETLQHLDESLELAIDELSRGLFDDEGLKPWSRDKLRELMVSAKQHLEGARSETAGLILLADKGEVDEQV